MKRLQLYYWYIGLPVLMVVLGSVVFFDAIMSTVKGNPHPQINYIIFVLVAAGCYQMLAHVRRINREGNLFRQYRRMVQNDITGEEIEVLVKDLRKEYDVAPLIQLIEGLRGTALTSVQHSAVESEMERFAARQSRRLILAQFMGGLMVGMGLLGTFIGLLGALAEIGKLIGSFNLGAGLSDPLATISELVARLTAPMQAMGVAFSASLFGVLGSLVMGVLMVGVRGASSDLVSFVQSDTSLMLEIIPPEEVQAETDEGTLLAQALGQLDTTGRLSTGGFVNAGNYTFSLDGLSTVGTVNFNGSALNSGVLTVDPKTLTLSAGSVIKAYDGTTSLTGRALVPNGGMSGDQIHVTSTSGSFSGKNAGNQNFTLSGLQLQGSDRANYAFASSSVSGTGTITPKVLTVSALAQDKVYDGTASASVVSLGLNGVITGDAVSAAGGSAAFADKNVARDAAGQVISQAVTVSGLSLIGIDAGNYSLGSTTASTVALMTPKSLDVLGTLVADKPEDGNTSARVTVGSLSGLVGPELLRVTAQGNFLNADVGTDKPVDVSYALLNGINGGLAANYSISNQMFKANITSVSKSNPVQPVITPSKPASSSKVVIANAQAAVGRSDTESKNEIRQECSFLHPEKCECQDTAVVGVQLCVAPAPTEARGVDLTDRLNAVLGLPAK